MDPRQIRDTFEAIEAEARRVFVGQDAVLSDVLVGMLARGHVLLEGVPGVGKTLLVRALSRVLGCHSRRVQFTPDLMPSDVTGSTLYNAQRGEFEFKHGPVFTNLLLADEINRAPAKTQSAMLESMAERSVTVDGTTHPLPDPYFVLATQNPLESAGTYPLPEAQLDRFMLKVRIEHPSQAVEDQLLAQIRDGFDAADLDRAQLRQVVDVAQLVKLREAIQQLRVDDAVIHYITSLVANSRAHRAVQIGASPRASIALFMAGRVEAAIQGRSYVVPDDVKQHGQAVLRHRLILQPDAEIEGVTAEEVVQSILQHTPVPNMTGGQPSDRPSTPPTPQLPASAGAQLRQALSASPAPPQPGPGAPPAASQPGPGAPQPGPAAPPAAPQPGPGAPPAPPAPAGGLPPDPGALADPGLGGAPIHRRGDAPAQPAQAQPAQAQHGVPIHRRGAQAAPPPGAQPLVPQSVLRPFAAKPDPSTQPSAPPPVAAPLGAREVSATRRPESGPAQPAGLRADQLPPTGAGPLAGPNPFDKRKP